MFLVQDRPNWTGGPIINVRRLLPAWKAAGFDVIAPTGYREDAPNARFLESKGILCPLFKMPAPTEAYTTWILQQVALHQPDVFIGDTHVAAGYALPWLNAWGIHSVMMVRNLDAYNLEVAYAFFGKKNSKNASALVCVNARIKAEILKKRPLQPDRIRVIPSGAPASAYHASWPNDDAFQLVYSGVLMEERKRVLKLWEAYCFAVEQIPNLHLTFIGDGPLRPQLEQLVAHSGLQDKVSFTGLLLDDAYKQKLSQQHVLLLFSDHEGTPGSVMDDMSCGVVPLCRNMEGIETLVKHGENGLIFDGSKEDFVQQLKKLWEEHFWKRCSAAALHDFACHFSLETTLTLWQSLMEELFSRPLAKSLMKVPDHIILPPVRYHFANADRRKFPLYFILRGVYIIWQRITGGK